VECLARPNAGWVPCGDPARRENYHPYFHLIYTCVRDGCSILRDLEPVVYKYNYIVIQAVSTLARIGEHIAKHAWEALGDCWPASAVNMEGKKERGARCAARSHRRAPSFHRPSTRTVALSH
jgi:hypothetical protein